MELLFSDLKKKSKRMNWLSNAIYDYLKTHENADSVDIVSHFKLRADITLSALAELITEGKVARRMYGMNSRYEILK